MFNYSNVIKFEAFSVIPKESMLKVLLKSVGLKLFGALC